MDNMVAVNPGAIGGLTLISDLQNQIMLRDHFLHTLLLFIASNKHRASTVKCIKSNNTFCLDHFTMWRSYFFEVTLSRKHLFYESAVHPFHHPLSVGSSTLFDL